MTPEQLLSLLSETWTSWSELCRVTKTPQTELARALRELQVRGFPVIVEEPGARLAPGTPAPQMLLPLLRGKLGRPYRYLGTVPNTQDVLRAWSEAPAGALVLAERQTKGRGRMGRVWESPPGNLYFSLLLGEDVDDLLPLRVGVALVEATQVGHLKWPNDLLAPDGRKLGGILVERAGSRVFLGVGVNVEIAPLPTAAALREFRSVRRATLLADFLWSLESWLSEKSSVVFAAWKKHSITLGRRVVIQTARERIEGLALDLGPNGELLISTEWGLRRVTTGDVELGAAQDVEDPQIGQGQA